MLVADAILGEADLREEVDGVRAGLGGLEGHVKTLSVSDCINHRKAFGDLVPGRIAALGGI